MRRQIALPASNGESAARTHRTHAIHFNLKCLGTPTTEFDSPDIPCNLRNTSRFAFRSARMGIEKWRFPGAPQKKSSGPSYTQNRTGWRDLYRTYVELLTSDGIASVKVCPCPRSFPVTIPRHLLPRRVSPTVACGQCQTE